MPRTANADVIDGTPPASERDRGQAPAGRTVFGLFRKRTYRLPELARDVIALGPRAPGALGIWFGHRMDPATREAIMVAVARANACRYCSFVHREWALAVGLPDDDLARIEGMDADSFDRERWLAATYGQSTITGDLSPEIEREASEVFDAATLRDIETVARVMTIMNRSGNTVDALLSRLGGTPTGGSRLPDEVVLTILMLLVGPPVILSLSLGRREAPWSVLRRLDDFARDFDERLDGTGTAPA